MTATKARAGDVQTIVNLAPKELLAPLVKVVLPVGSTGMQNVTYCCKDTGQRRRMIVKVEEDPVQATDCIVSRYWLYCRVE